MSRNRELLASARFEPVAPSKLPVPQHVSPDSNDIISCMRYAIPRCMSRIVQNEYRQLDPRKDFTYKATTVFTVKSKDNNSDQRHRGCTGSILCSTSSGVSDDFESSEEDEVVETSNPPMTFQFTEYSPMCFSHVRSFFGVHSRSFGRVLRDSNWHATPSPGKSFAHIFFCDQWVIKTMTPAESNFLQDILHRYYYHVRDNPSTFLPHFVGHYQIQRGMGFSYNLIVMRNVFLTKTAIHRIYDLKGSTVGRFVSTNESQQTARLMKDLDLNSPIRIGAERKKLFMRQIIKDTEFLKKCEIMDYSLLVGIHEQQMCSSTAKLNSDSPSDEFHPSLSKEERRRKKMMKNEEEEGDFRSSHHAYSKKRRFSDPHGVDVRFPEKGNRGDAHAHSTLTGGKTSDGVGEIRLRKGVNGGIQSTVNPGFRNEVYYAGVIDILQQYTTRKRLEHMTKGLAYGLDKISCVSPNHYAERFVRFIDSIIV